MIITKPTCSLMKEPQIQLIMIEDSKTSI